MLRYYVEMRSAEPQLFNLQSYPFGDAVSEPDVIRAFKDKYATFKRKVTPTEVLLRIADTHSWNFDDITMLSALPVDEYYNLFKSAKGNLREVISACLMFDTMQDANSNYQEVVKRAKEALKLIGQESRINARRVKAYGVEIDDANPLA